MSDLKTLEFWLAPENAGALKELEARQPELAAFVRMVEQRVEEKMREVVVSNNA